MKKNLAVLVVVILGLSFLLYKTTNEVMAEDAAKKTPPPIGNLSDITAPLDEPSQIKDNCNAVRETMKNKFSGDNQNLDTLVQNEKKQGMVSVYLSENIDKKKTPYRMSCSQVISCMRTANITAGEEKKRIGSATQEMLIIKTLREEYPECIVEAKDGLTLLSTYAAMVYKWISGIVGAICILTIVISGIQISIGGLSQEEVSGAKDRISRALIGMVVLFLSAFILYTINPIFFT